jgi:uncharacterized membrane protein YhdT
LLIYYISSLITNYNCNLYSFESLDIFQVKILKDYRHKITCSRGYEQLLADFICLSLLVKCCLLVEVWRSSYTCGPFSTGLETCLLLKDRRNSITCLLVAHSSSDDLPTFNITLSNMDRRAARYKYEIWFNDWLDVAYCSYMHESAAIRSWYETDCFHFLIVAITLCLILNKMVYSVSTQHQYIRFLATYFDVYKTILTLAWRWFCTGSGRKS